MALGHRAGTRFLETITFGKRPMTFSGRMGSLVDSEAVAFRALFHQHMLVLEQIPLGEARGKYITEQHLIMQRLAQDLNSPEWEHLPVVVEGRTRDGLVYRERGAWAAAIDLDEQIAIGMRGISVEPDEHELVAIDDLSRYPSQRAGR